MVLALEKSLQSALHLSIWTSAGLESLTSLSISGSVSLLIDKLQLKLLRGVGAKATLTVKMAIAPRPVLVRRFVSEPHVERPAGPSFPTVRCIEALFNDQ